MCVFSELDVESWSQVRRGLRGEKAENKEATRDTGHQRNKSPLFLAQLGTSRVLCPPPQPLADSGQQMLSGSGRVFGEMDKAHPSLGAVSTGDKIGPLQLGIIARNCSQLSLMDNQYSDNEHSIHLSIFNQMQK